MAKKRVNTRFVAILGVSLLVLGGAVYAIRRVTSRAHPEQFIAAAHEAEASRRWADAADNWGKAINSSPPDPSLWNSLGNADHQLAQTDITAAKQLRDLAAWQRALEIDPNYLPALKSLMAFWQEQWRASPSVEAYRNARDRADQILRLAPNDPGAPDVQEFLYTTTVEGWLSGLETDDSRVADAETGLRAMMAKDPTDAKLPYYAAQIDIHRAQIATHGSLESDQPASATALYKRAAKEMTTALAKQGKNAALHYYAALIYSALSEADRSPGDVRGRDVSLADQQMDQAVALVKGDDPFFIEISVGAAQMAAKNNNTPKAMGILTRLMKERGSDVQAVLEAAPQLGAFAALRPQAENTLEAALPQSAGADLTWRNFNILSALTDMEINDLAGASNDADKAKLKAQVNHNIDELNAANIDRMRVVDAQSRMAMNDHDFIGAVQILTQGMAADQRIGDNAELMWRLAQAYDGANEREQAKDYCLRVVQGSPNFIPARRMLVDILSTEGTEEARRQISQQLNYLNRISPDDPYVIRLQIMQLDPTVDADQIKTMYAKLPEKTPLDMQVKGAVAAQKIPGQPGIDEATRLFNMAVAAAPQDPSAVMDLARLYAGTNRRADAIATVERGMITLPKDLNLQLLLKQLEDAPASEIAKIQSQVAEQNLNPLTRDVQLAKDAMAANDAAGAEKQLDTAAKIDPKNKDVLEAYFSLYLAEKKWDKLGPIVAALGEINADEAHGLLYQFYWAKAQGDVPRQIQIGVKLTTDLSEFAMSYFCLGQAYEAQGQYEQAINNYDTALRKKGQGPDAANMLKAEIGCYYKLNRPDQAFQSIEEGRRRFSDDDEFRLMEIQHESDNGKPEDAAAHLEDLLQLHPDVPSVYMDLSSADMQVASMKLRIGDTGGATAAAATARNVIKQAIERFPDNADFYQRLSEILRFSGDNTGAEAALMGMMDRPALKDQAGPQKMLGQFYSLTGQLAKSETAYAKALSLASDAEKGDVEIRYAGVLSEEGKYAQALAILPENTDSPTVRRQRVNVLVQAGRMPDAEKEIKLIVTKNPTEKSDLETGWALLELGADRRPQAAEHLANALEADPHNVHALVMRARLKTLQTPPDLDGAMADLNTARGLAPSDVNVLSTIADVQTDLLNFDQAAGALEAALRADPTNFTIRIRLAFMYANNQPVRLDQALTVLQDGVSQSGGDTNPDLFNDIANVYEQMGKPDQAMSTVATALKRMPNSLALIRNYLRLSLVTRQYQMTIDSATQVISQRPDLWWAWQYRGQAHARFGDKTGAMSDLIQALAGAETEKEPAAPASIVEAISKDVDSAKAIELVKKRLGTNPQWDYILILLYHQNGQDAEAIKLLNPLVAAGEKLPAERRLPRLELAGTIYSTAQPKPYAQQAYDTYKELLGLNPKDVQALNNFACVCADDFQPPKVEEGMVAIRRAMDLLSGNGSSDAMVEDTYGWLLILDGQTNDGIDMIRKAVGRQEFPEAHYHLGEAYLRLNRPQDAQQQVNLALDDIAKAQQANQQISPTIRSRVEDLSNRVLGSLRMRTSGSVP